MFKTNEVLKAILLTLAGGLLVGLVGFMFVFKWSPRAQKAWDDVENSSRVTVGMTTTEMLQIMGPCPLYLTTRNCRQSLMMGRQRILGVVTALFLS